MSLSDVFDESKSGGLSAFDSVEAAPEFSPLPAGVYRARVVRGEYCRTRSGVDAYRIRFEVIEGPETGRTVQRMWTFGGRALPYSKRDLAAFGLTTSKQLLEPFPSPGREIICRLVVALQRGDDGVERNDLKRVDVLEVRDSPVAEFLIDGDETK